MIQQLSQAHGKLAQCSAWRTWYNFAWINSVVCMSPAKPAHFAYRFRDIGYFVKLIDA
jgi:hypothetical protein